MELVKKYSSKRTSIEIINRFYYYANGHLNRIIKLKIFANPKICKEEEKEKGQ